MGKIILLSCIAVLIAFSGVGFAEEKPVFTREEILGNFHENPTFKEALQQVQQRALWLAEQGEDGLDEFSAPFSKWNTLDGKHPQFQVWQCNEGKVLRHPNPALHHLVGLKDLASKFKDHAGRLQALHLCQKLLATPQGAWDPSYTTWQKSITKSNELFYTMFLGAGVPGRPWQIVASMPVDLKSMEEAVTLSEMLNEKVNEWSLKEFTKE